MLTKRKWRFLKIYWKSKK